MGQFLSKKHVMDLKETKIKEKFLKDFKLKNKNKTEKESKNVKIKRKKKLEFKTEEDDLYDLMKNYTFSSLPQKYWRRKSFSLTSDEKMAKAIVFLNFYTTVEVIMPVLASLEASSGIY